MRDSLVDDDDDRPAKRIKLEARPPRFQVPPAVPAPGANPLPQARLLPLSPRGFDPLHFGGQQHGHQAQAQLLPYPLPSPPPLLEHHRDNHLHNLHLHHQNQYRHEHPPPLHYQAPSAQPGHPGAPPASTTMAALPPLEDANGCWPSGGSDLFDSSWKWPSSSPVPPQPHMVLPFQPSSSCQLNALDVFSKSAASPPVPLPPLSLTAALPAAELNFSPASPTHDLISRPPSHVHKRPRLHLAATGDAVADGPQLRGQIPRKPTSKAILVSPFKDCVGNFGDIHHRRFHRPLDGKVNGYIKFNWPKDQQPRRPSSTRPPSSVSTSPGVSAKVLSPTEVDAFATSLVPLGPSAAPSGSAIILSSLPPDVSLSYKDIDRFFNDNFSEAFDFSPTTVSPVTSSVFDSRTASGSPTTTDTEISTELVRIGAPRKIPPQMGYDAKMDATDRAFWSFYIYNWCPGRSVLLETNLWLKDFAQMHKSDGVRAAIQSLAGIYIYDYQPIDRIRKRVNDRFYDAEARLSRLLNDPATSHDESQANELITIAVILSMQDIVLTERRLKKPQDPRWLQGFKQGEMFLQLSDRGSRFWKRTNAQLSSLRISQSIIVGRAVILAQPMMRLPAPDSFDPEHEASRFGWLLYGTEQDMYQIHGGCGFSKKLLHMMSQITYCAARLRQDPENIVVPMTTQYLLQELDQMRQWSSESKDWETAKVGPSVIQWVRSLPDDFIIKSSADMTDVTAEAWRLTAIIYLQCRVLRLPRCHSHVVASLADLARCIHIMPTSGYQFTAQAPLFPVFLLGMLATNPDHRKVSQTWFDEVVSTPVRSSVPPLYEALQRIWQWIDVEIELPLSTTLDPGSIGFRYPWWEHLVLQVNDKESEVLCLT